MKKTEKIEVRLSHEEKTALTNLAEQESRSVSDLVRGLIERYMSINTTRLPRRTPWLVFGTIGLGGFFAGHIATYLITKSHSNSHSPLYNMSVGVGSDVINFPVLERQGQNEEFTIPSKDGNIIVKTLIEKEPETLGTITIELCRKHEKGCELIAAPSLQFNPNFQSAISFKDQSNQGIYIRLNPSIQDRR